MADQAEILVVGAGPTGLVLALSLARQGVPCRVVSRAEGPGTASRAMIVHARTLELYRALGIGDAVSAAGIPARSVFLREAGDEVLRLDLADLGTALSPYPYILAFPQDDHERLLVAALRDAGVAVEWRTELVGLAQDGEGITATLRRDGHEEVARCRWLCGCDGARSAVRHALGIGFPGGDYDQRFFVADVALTGESAGERITACLGARELCLVLPVRRTGQHRLIGLIPGDVPQDAPIAFEAVRGHAEALAGVTVEALHWFSTYRVHHRVAERFQQGRAFLLGDAGHIHSPAGGQGMNTGIGDAVNLGWKLAQVARGRAPATLLDSYAAERLAFARTLVGTTDRMFRAMVEPGLSGRVLRTVLVPHLLPAALGFRAARRAFFRALSQLRISYRDGPLAGGAAGEVHGGDRLPWVRHVAGDNFEPLAALDWQLHVYGTPAPALREAAEARGLALLAFPWDPAAAAAGLAEDAAYLVRPDGYVGLAMAQQDPAVLAAWLDRHGLAGPTAGRPGAGDDGPGRAPVHAPCR
ncbi:FAD-dependent monooxygenase [Roseomonas sp. NAR14]|uniref:FAD-dependent monooxygenase n=1 Tax=Roseomonas acroporae TaxID=2937791 RepID=A0A9X1Y8L2_9PROT|nr:FAD-dependent monooxygenase [Roseomonas acroporae]MCK8785092.1 FAD-dependent monooxygenase [Roseomonas acroporae]